MSSAIHSEVVELILSVDKFEQKIKVASTLYETAKAVMEKPMTLFNGAATSIAAYNESINALKSNLASLSRQQEEFNRKALSHSLRSQAQGINIRDSKGAIIGVNDYTQEQASARAARAATDYKIQLLKEYQQAQQKAATADTAQLDFEKQLAGVQAAHSKAEIARTKLEADQIVTKYKLERDLEASNALSKEVLDKQIADKRADNNRKRQADIRATADAEAAHQKMIMEFESRRNPNTGNFLANQARARGAFGSDVTGGNAGQLAMVAANNAKAALDKENADRDAAYAELKADLTRKSHEYINANSNQKQLAMIAVNNAKDALDKENADRDAAYAELKADLARRGEAGIAKLAKQDAALQRRLEEAAVTEELRKQLAEMNKLDAAEKKLLADTKLRALEAIKATTGYKVGSTLTNAKGSSVLSGAGMLSFAGGANGLGGMFYMAERLSNALNLGQKTLGDYAAKLGLVKLEGEGAEASIAAFGRGAMNLGGILALIAAPIATMFAGNKLNVALAQMSTLMADATVTGEKFTTMLQAANGSAVKLSASFGVDVVEVVEGFKLALSTGIDASQMERFTEIALTMGKGLGASLSQSVSILTTFKDAFAGTVEDTVGYSDVLFNAINVGKFNIEQLNANIGRVAVTAAEAGVGFKDMMAALATLNRVGMSTSQAITALNQFIVSIVNPSDKAKKAMDGLGIAYGAAALKGKSLMAVVADIKAKIGSNNDLYGEIFSEERARRGAIGLAANPGLMATNTAEMEKQGTAAVAAARAMDTFSAQMGKIWSVISAVIQSVGSDLLNIAKDVFFPSGAMGKDTLAQIAIAMEGIGVVIKEIGIVIIGVTGTVWNLLKLLGSIGGAIGKLLTGDVSGAIAIVDRALMDLGNGVINAFAAMITTVGTSADRVGQYMSKVGAETDDVTDKVKEATSKIATMTDAFSSFSDTTIGKTKGVINKYDELLAKIDQVAKAAKQAQVDAEFEAGYKKFDKNGEVNTSKSKEYRLFSGAAERVNDLKSRMDAPGYGDINPIAGERTSGDVNLRQIRDRRELAEAVKYLNEQQAIYVAWLDTERKTVYEKDKDAARQKLYKERGISTETSSYPAASSAKDAEDTAGLLRDLTEAQKLLMGTVLPSMSAMSDAALIARTDQLNKQISSLEDATIAIRGASLSQSDEADALLIATAHRKELEEEITSIKKEQATRDAKSYEEGTKAFIDKWKLVFKQAAKQEELYKKEYAAAVSLYNLKMKHFNAERDRIQQIITSYDNLIEKITNRTQELAFGERGPGRERRMYKDQIETDIKAAKSIADPVEAEKAFARINAMIEKFMSATTADGGERRGVIEGTAFYNTVKEMVEANKAKLATEDAKVAAQQGKAHDTLITSTADNPVAIAARQYADDVVKETLGVAAKHGLSVSGDLVSHVEINGVEVNIPVERLRDAVKQTVGVEMARIYADLIKRNPPPNANDRPPGDL